MLKKIMAIIFVLMLSCGTIFAADGGACTGWDCVETEGTYQGQVHNWDHESDLNTNDLAEAYVDGLFNGKVETFSSGLGLFGVSEHGYVSGHITNNAYANAWDFGRSSMSNAVSTFSGGIEGNGKAFGAFCSSETVDIELGFSGDVYQNNNSGEIGYPENQGISAGSYSHVNMSVNREEHDRGWFSACDSDRLFANMETSGDSYVTIDPYGDYRSMRGNTHTESSVFTNGDIENLGMNGSGGVNGLVQNGMSYAFGNTGFDYDIRSRGVVANSNLYGFVNKYGDTVSVQVKGGSSVNYSGPCGPYGPCGTGSFQ